MVMKNIFCTYRSIVRFIETKQLRYWLLDVVTMPKMKQKKRNKTNIVYLPIHSPEKYVLESIKTQKIHIKILTFCRNY